VAGGLLPDDDLYARLEVGVDASPEAIEVAWRALLRRHHPDVAGSDPEALERAKRINVAHDWLSDPTLRDRYDADRLGLGPIARGGARRAGYRPRVSR
jgi:molecular chaperone DnaJ